MCSYLLRILWCHQLCLQSSWPSGLWSYMSASRNSRRSIHTSFILPTHNHMSLSMYVRACSYMLHRIDIFECQWAGYPNLMSRRCVYVHARMKLFFRGVCLHLRHAYTAIHTHSLQRKERMCVSHLNHSPLFSRQIRTHRPHASTTYAFFSHWMKTLCVCAVAGRIGGDGAQPTANSELSAALAWTNFHFFVLPNNCSAMQVCMHECYICCECMHKFCMHAYRFLVSLLLYSCMYVCMYVCMHVCLYVMHVCVCVCMYVCMYVCMRVCVYACMHVCMHV